MTSKGCSTPRQVVLLRRIVDPAPLPDEPLISTITLAELFPGPLVAQDDVERASRQAVLQQAEATFVPLDVDAAAARAFGRVAAALRVQGRKHAVRGFDALIAAVAISRDLPVCSCNPRDFSGIESSTCAVPHPGS